MKRKKLVYILVAICLLVSSIGLTACGGVDCKVNFVVDENVYDTVATNGNETIKLPSNPVKDGYEFEGWYWDNGKWEKPFTVNSLLNTPLAADMSVYAKFTHNEHCFDKSVSNFRHYGRELSARQHKFCNYIYKSVQGR